MSAVAELRGMAGERRTRRRRRGPGPKVHQRDNRAAFLFLAPWIIGFLFITVGPLIASLVLSFTDDNLLRLPEYIGLDNFREMLDDRRLWPLLLLVAPRFLARIGIEGPG